MKKLFIPLFIFFTGLSFGQSNYEIADSTKEWNTVLSTIGGWGILHCGGTYINYFGEEFFYNDERCLMVRQTKDSTYLDWEEVGFLREDTLNRRVFFDGGLLYDFSIGLGDSVIIDNHYIGFTDQLMVCDSIGSIILNGEVKKQFYFDPYLPGYFDDIWIEGIGSIYGFLFSGIYAANYTGGMSNLVCCKENDTTIYYDSIYWDCFIDDFYPRILTGHFDTAYVGLDYVFQLLVDTNQVDSFSINGEIIPEGFSFDETTFLLTGKPDSAGTYTCAITASNYDLNVNSDLLFEEIVVVLPTHNIEHSEQSEANIYPNPFSSIVYVEIKPLNNITYQMEVFNAKGGFIEEIIIKNNYADFDVSHYKKGLYFFRISDNHNKNVILKKMMKL